MGKIEDLQNVLKVYLTNEDVSYIKEYWKAMYENPSEFENDRVCDMVLSDLKKTPIENWNELNGGKKNMDMEIALLGVPDLKVNHFTPDNTLAWGKYKNSNIMIKSVTESLTYPIVDYKVDTVNAYADCHKGPVYVIVATQDYSSVLAFGFEHEWLVDTINTRDLVPSGYELIGEFSFELNAVKDLSTVLRIASDLYVPFAQGPNGSIIPVIWALSRYADVNCNYNAIRIAEPEHNLCITDDYVHSVMQNIEMLCPKVDLDVDKDKRYSCISVKFDVHGEAFFGYNRNHVAYNGAIEDYRSMMPIILAILSCAEGRLVETNILDYICGKIDASQIIIRYAGDEVRPINPLGTITVAGSEDKPSEKDDPKMKGSDNPLIRAAQRANTKFE